MTYLQQLRGFNVPVLLVDGGDVFFRAASRRAPTRAEMVQPWKNARVLAYAYSLLGYQAVAVGPNDLHLGLDKLQALGRMARFPLLCANLIDKTTKETYFKPYEIVELGGIRFGIYAVMQEKLNPTYARRAIPNGELRDPVEVTGEVLDELKGKCDVIVALSHLSEEVNQEILEKYPRIDVLVDPLTRFGSKAIWVGDDDDYCRDIHGTPRLRIDGQGSRIGVFEMHIGRDTKKIEKYVGYNVPLEPHLMGHPAMLELIDTVRRGRTYEFPADFDPSKVQLSEALMGQETCGGCHEAQHEFWKKTRHASNFDTLKASHNERTANCIGCHTLGYGVAFARTSEIGEFREVQCESCHGFNPEHASDPSEHPYEHGVKESTCLGCHNPEHTGKVAHSQPAFTSKLLSFDEALPLVSCPRISN